MGMEPWQSWAIVGAVGAGAAYYYSTSGNKKRGRGAKPPTQPLNQSRGSKPRTDSRDKRNDSNSGASDQVASDVADVSSASVPGSGNEGMKKRKAGKKSQPSKLAQSSAIDVNGEQSVDAGKEDEVAKDEGMDNAEFAKQFSNARTGASLKKPETTENKKSRKENKRNEAPGGNENGSAHKANGAQSSQDLSTASSTTGADADDDLSAATSPELGATQTTTPSAADVSDMLEAPAKGPSVLRLTEPTNPQPIRQPKVQKAAQEPETKHQRQRRQKKEEEKVIREQIEKERLVALETQRRTVREAEGRPMKNGLRSITAPSSNAWSKPSTTDNHRTGTMAPPPKQQNTALLDTFDEPVASVNPNSNRQDGTVSEQKVWHNDVPSEEEQMRMFSEMDSDNSWNTVQKGGKAKKKATEKAAAQTPAGYSVKDSSGVEKKVAPSGMNADVTAETPSTTNQDKYTVRNIYAEMDKLRLEASREKPTGRVKATKETIDHSVWNRSNIKEHPDYDPDYPYALTGHPADSDWAVI